MFVFVNLLWFKYKRRIPLLCTLTFVKSLNTTASFWHPSGVMLLIRVRSLLTSPSWRPMTLMNELFISFIEIQAQHTERGNQGYVEVRALASLQCGLGSNPIRNTIYGLSLLVVLALQGRSQVLGHYTCICKLWPPPIQINNNRSRS